MTKCEEEAKPAQRAGSSQGLYLGRREVSVATLAPCPVPVPGPGAAAAQGAETLLPPCLSAASMPFSSMGQQSLTAELGSLGGSTGRLLLEVSCSIGILLNLE